MFQSGLLTMYAMAHSIAGCHRRECDGSALDALSVVFVVQRKGENGV